MAKTTRKKINIISGHAAADKFYGLEILEIAFIYSTDLKAYCNLRKFRNNKNINFIFYYTKLIN